MGIASLAVNALICLLVIESICRRSFDSVLVWSANYASLFLRTWCWIFTFDLCIGLLRGRLSRGARWGNGLLFALAMIDYFKMEYRNEPLLLSDFVQTSEALRIMPKIHFVLPLWFWGALALLVFLLPLLIPGQRLPKGLRRIPFSALGIGAFLLASVGLFRQDSGLPLQYEALFEQTGMIRALGETRRSNFTPPANYSREAVLSALEARLEGEAPPSEATLTPDIFFIMSESFYDPAAVGDLQLTGDALAPLRSTLAAFPHGQIMALGYGGGTFSSEYEVLTGYRFQDVPGVAHVNTDAMRSNTSVIRPGMQTIVSALRDAGYATEAIHPNTGKFYVRQYAYSAVGFERALFSDNGMPDLPLWGDYPSDRALFDFLLTEYQNRDPSRPSFFHTVTYQNHAAYLHDPVPGGIEVLNREGDQQLAAQNFANGILESSRVLQDFLETLSREERPIVVVFWGDHAPNLAMNFGISMPEDTLSRVPYYTTPFLIWNNFGAEWQVEEALPPYRLGAWLLCQLGLTKDAYYRSLANAAQPDMMTVLRLLESDGVYTQDEPAYAAQDAALYLLHYDRLEGENYGKELDEP